jgi:hypothetical protein
MITIIIFVESKPHIGFSENFVFLELKETKRDIHFIMHLFTVNSMWIGIVIFFIFNLIFNIFFCTIALF